MQTNESEPIKYYDGTQVGIQFVQYFYENWIKSPLIMLQDEIIKPYTKLKFNNGVHQGEQIINLLETFRSGLTFTNCKYDIHDSGSRQIYILVKGQIQTINQSNGLTMVQDFSQSFMIAYTGENNKKSLKKWNLMNSILLI